MIKSGDRVLLVGALILVVGGMVVWSIKRQNTAPKELSVVRVGYVPDSVNHAPIMVAQDKKFFEGRNIKVELQSFTSGKEVAQALASGQIEVGAGGITNYLTAIAQDVPIRIIAPMAASPSQVYVRPGSSLKTFADLKGVNIGAKPGSGDAFAIQYALRAENIDRSSVELLDIANALRPQALMTSKAIDAAVGGEYEDAAYRTAGAILFPDWEIKGYKTKAFPRTVIAANVAALNARPKEMKEFIQAVIDAEKFMHDNQQESAVVVANHVNNKSSGAAKLTAESVVESWKQVSYSLWNPDNMWNDMASLAFEVGIAKRSLALSEFWDQRFTDILKSSQDAIYSSQNS